MFNIQIGTAKDITTETYFQDWDFSEKGQN